MRSKITWTVPFADDVWYSPLKLPSAASPRVMPFARLSPAVKLIVEEVLVTDGPRRSHPSPVASVTVTLPVTAIAFDGTCGTTPAMTNERALSLLNAPVRPIPWRVSSTRTGGSG